MTTGIKTLNPVRRASGVSHDDLVRHWRERHAPGVKAHMRPDRYAITFFDPHGGRGGAEAVYDGMAALAFDDRERARAVTGRNVPQEVATDGFVADLVEQPMTSLRVVEHVIVPGPSGQPATPEERQAAYKMTFFVRPGEGRDLAHIQRHWIDIHAPNVASSFVASGGVRYVVNLVDLEAGPQEFVGVAELSYRDRAAFKDHAIADDGFNALTSPSVVLRGQEWVVAG